MEPNEADRERAEALTSRGNSVHTRADQSVFQVLAEAFAAHRSAAEQATRAEIAKLLRRESRKVCESYGATYTKVALLNAADLIEKGA